MASHTFRLKTVKDAGEVADMIFLAHGLKLKAEKKDDVVHGHVNTSGAWVEVVIYENDELPTKEHETTFQKAAIMPAKTDIEAIFKSKGLIN